jgi:hypothetical protein
MVLWGPEFQIIRQHIPSYFKIFDKEENFEGKLNIRTTFFNEIIYKKTNKSIVITSVHFQVPKNPSGTNKGEQTFLSLLEDAKNLGNFVIIGDYNLKHPEFITLYNNNKDTIAEFGYSKKQTNFKGAHMNKNQLVPFFYERLDYGVFSKNIKINEERIHDNMKIDWSTKQLEPGSSDHAKVSYKITIE